MSQKDGVSKEIDGRTYTVYMLGPTVAMDMLIDIGKVVGPALSSLGQDAAVLDQEINARFFASAASGLFANLNKATLREVTQTLAKTTLVDDVALDKIYESHFRGRLGSLAKWLAFALQVQYGNFLSALGDASNPAQMAAAV